jgi:hypothetical protein
MLCAPLLADTARYVCRNSVSGTASLFLTTSLSLSREMIFFKRGVPVERILAEKVLQQTHVKAGSIVKLAAAVDFFYAKREWGG